MASPIRFDLFKPALAVALIALAVFGPNLVLYLGTDRPPDFDPSSAALNLLVLLGLCAAIGRLWVLWLVALPVAVLAPLEMFYIVEFKLASSAHIVGVVAETDADEALAWLGPTGLGIVAAGLLGALLCLYAAGAAFRHNLRWIGRTRVWVIGASLLAGLFIGFTAPERNADDATLADQGSADIHSTSADKYQVLTSLRMQWPSGIPIRLFDYLQFRTRLQAQQRQREGFRFNASRTRAIDAREVYVMVIGESLRADHLSLNGYPRDTTPRLAQRPSLISFTDMLSATSATRSAVPHLLVRPEAGRDPTQAAEPSLIRAFAEAGFRTYWLSTQSMVGKFDSAISILAHEADERRFINPASYTRSGTLDEGLLSELAAVLGRNEPRVLILLHMLGSHARYTDRYPEAFGHYQPTQRVDLWKRESAPDLRNAYDNSVRYTDHVIDRAIAQLDALGNDTLAWMFFVSDHGETLFDGTCARAGHGFASWPNHRPAMLFWPSNRFARDMPQLVTALKARHAARLAWDIVFPTVLDLGSVGTERSAAALSAAHPAFSPAPRRIDPGSGSWIDADRDMHRLDCSQRTSPP